MKAYRRAPLIADRRQALTVAAILWLAGAVVMWDAYEARGVKRPTLVRVAGAAQSLF